MISRDAENCFWLYRNIERAVNMARFINVNRAFVLDVKPKLTERWFPLVIVAGEEHSFLKLYDTKGTLDDELIQDYLTWNKKNSVSIFSALSQARENARNIRSLLSTEIWEAINTFWLWLKSKAAKRLFQSDCHAFYEIIIQNCELFHGLYRNSLLRDEAYYFMSLGMVLERANQVARIMDVKYHRMSLGSSMQSESAQETIHWLALLKCCSATESFLKQTHDHIKRKEVAHFLLLDDIFPRSILFCLLKAKQYLTQLNPNENAIIKERSYFLLFQLIKSLKQSNLEEMIESEIHTQLTLVVNTTSDICQSIHDEFFDPELFYMKEKNEIRLL